MLVSEIGGVAEEDEVGVVPLEDGVVLVDVLDVVVEAPVVVPVPVPVADVVVVEVLAAEVPVAPLVADVLTAEEDGAPVDDVVEPPWGVHPATAAATSAPTAIQRPFVLIVVPLTLSSCVKSGR